MKETVIAALGTLLIWIVFAILDPGITLGEFAACWSAHFLFARLIFWLVGQK